MELLDVSVEKAQCSKCCPTLRAGWRESVVKSTHCRHRILFLDPHTLRLDDRSVELQETAEFQNRQTLLQVLQHLRAFLAVEAVNFEDDRLDSILHFLQSTSRHLARCG